MRGCGAPSARHSLRPLNFRWLYILQTSRKSCGEIAEVCSYPSSAKRGEGGAKRRVGVFFWEVETPPPDTSLVALTMCHPPHEGGGIRKRDRGADSRRCVWSSLRGANATKQSSFLSRAAMDCLASARNDGMEDRRLEP